MACLMEVNRVLKNSLRYFREEKGLTQRQVADGVGLSDKTVSFYERTEERVPKDYLQKAARVLGVPVEKLEEQPMSLEESSPPCRANRAFDLRDVSTPNLEQVLRFMVDEYRTGKNEAEKKRALANLAAAADELVRRDLSFEITRAADDLCVGTGEAIYKSGAALKPVPQAPSKVRPVSPSAIAGQDSTIPGKKHDS